MKSDSQPLSVPQILVADDHTVIREHISALIHELISQAVIHEARDYSTLMDVIHKQRPALAICDIHMPGCNGYHMIKTITSLQPEMKLIIFTAYNADIYANQMIRSGAHAFLNKEAESSVIKETIRNIWQGQDRDTNNPEAQVKGVVSPAQDSNNPLARLSSRELEVAGMMVRGLGGIEICQELDLYKTTVSTIKKRIYTKLAISSLPELVAIFQVYSGSMT